MGAGFRTAASGSSQARCRHSALRAPGHTPSGCPSRCVPLAGCRCSKTASLGQPGRASGHSIVSSCAGGRPNASVSSGMPSLCLCRAPRYGSASFHVRSVRHPLSTGRQRGRFLVSWRLYQDTIYVSETPPIQIVQLSCVRLCTSCATSCL